MTGTAPATVHARLAARHEAHAARIADFVRVPSISPERTGIAEGAAFMLESLRACGCDDAALIDVGDGFPGVWGSIDAGARETLLVYGHYDVRPVGAEPWTQPPFSGARLAQGPYPEVVMGRGAAAKAPLQGFCHAVEAARAATGRLPVNLMFLIEGAEILGSPNFPKLAAARADALRRATLLYGPRATQDAAGAVAVTLGYKGLICLELVAGGKAWGRGPQGSPVHSATAAVVENPAWRLAHALAAIADAAGVRLPGLAAALAATPAPPAWEAPFAAALAARIAASGADAVLPGLSPAAPVARFREGLSGEALLQAYMRGASCNIFGLRAGFTGPGTKPFLVPAEARASLDLRVVSDTPAEALVGLLRQGLDEAGLADVGIDLACAYDAHQTAPDATLAAAALAGIAALGLSAQVWPMQAFGGPWAHYGRALGIPFLFGAAPGFGARAATSDEFFVLRGDGRVADLATVEGFYADLLYRLDAGR